MTSDQTQRFVLRGLFITLTLLIIALVLQLTVVFLLIEHDDLTVADAETIASISGLAVLAVAVVGILSMYVKTLSQKD